MKLVLLFVSLFAVLIANGQQSFKYEISVVSENDSYLWQAHDGYYSNGIFLQYSYLPKALQQRVSATSNLKKVTTYYQLGQLLYTPKSYKEIHPIDRPYAGYLFLQKGYRFFYKNRGVLETSLNVGFTGKPSLAEQMQDVIHDIMGFPQFPGWKYQVKTALGVNVQAKYNYAFVKGKRLIGLDAATEAKLGNIFTNAGAGIVLKFGRFNNPYNSSLYQASIGDNNENSKPELFVYFQPMMFYEAYNATLQGRLISSNKGSVLASPRNAVYKQEIGFVYSRKRWTAMAKYFYSEKEARSMANDERYGSFTFAYRFGKTQ